MDSVPPRRKARSGPLVLTPQDAEAGCPAPVTVEPLPDSAMQKMRALTIACIAFGVPLEQAFGSVPSSPAAEVRSRNVPSRRRGGGPQ
jgi:hypothetical protein